MSVITGSIVTITFCLGIVGYFSLLMQRSWKMRKIATALTSDLENIIDKSHLSVDCEMSKTIAKFISHTKQASRELNINSFVDNHYPEHNHVRFVRNGISSLVMLGLLGTFVGLIMSLKGTNLEALTGLADIFDQGARKEVLNKAIGTPLQGMKVAFYTSIYGITLSLFLTWFDSCRQRTWEIFLQKFENYLSNEIFQQYSPKSWEETGKLVGAEIKHLGEVLECSLSKFLELFSENIQKKFEESMNRVAINLENTSTHVVEASTRLSNLAGSFESSAICFKNTSLKFEKTVDSLPGNIALIEKNINLFIESFKIQSDYHIKQVISQQDQLITFQENLAKTSSKLLHAISSQGELYSKSIEENMKNVVNSIDVSMKTLQAWIEVSIGEVNEKQHEIFSGIMEEIGKTSVAMQEQNKGQIKALESGLNAIHRSVVGSSDVVSGFIEVLTSESLAKESAIQRVAEIQHQIKNALINISEFPHLITKMVAESKSYSESFIEALQKVENWVSSQRSDREQIFSQLEAILREQYNQTQTFVAATLTPSFERINKNLEVSEKNISKQSEYQKALEEMADRSRQLAVVIQGVGNNLKESSADFAQQLEKIKFQGDNTTQLATILQAILRHKGSEINQKTISTGTYDAR